ncbi:hypothetical protein VPHD239_0191 [Vibrio phage D239]
MIIWYYDKINTNKALRARRGLCAKPMCETYVRNLERVCANSMCKNYLGGNESEPAPPGPCANSTLCGLQGTHRVQ